MKKISVLSIIFVLVFMPVIGLAQAEQTVETINLEGYTSESNKVVEMETKDKQVLQRSAEEMMISLPQLESLKEEMKDFTSSSVGTMTNDNPNDAYYVNMETVYTDYITAEGQERWYFFENTNPGKLTVVLDTVPSSSGDYDLYLFKLNEDTFMLESLGASYYGPGMNEQISAISDEGIYFIAVASYQGFDVNNPFAFLITHSSVYSSNEPDDNIWQANVYANSIYTEGLIDNPFDLDWMVFNLAQAKSLALHLENQESSTVYKVDIFDTSLNLLTSLNENAHYRINFPAGMYFIRVSSVSSYSTTQPYKLSVRVPASRVAISQINSDGGVQGYINYGYGSKWRVKNNMTVIGQLYDSQNVPVPHTKVAIKAVRVINNQIVTGTGYTDANGNFSISVHTSHAAGQYAFNNIISTHYFDIIPMWAEADGVELTSNQNSLYHFAYQILN